VQDPGGGLPVRVESTLSRTSALDTRAAIRLLDAAQAQVRTTFDQGRGGIEETLDTHDPVWIVVNQWACQLPRCAQVAEIGCGTGRLLRPLAAEMPALQWLGVDACPSALEALPAQLPTRRGAALALPLESGSLDAVLAVELLEHTLVPSRALGELCRVLRPGGRLLIVDKRAECLAHSHAQPWERWCSSDELNQALHGWCDEVHVAPLPEPRGAFFACTARRREAGARRLAA
jgi:malonyl-CoA O-methyltransferase